MPTTVFFNWFIQSPVIGIWQKGWRHPESSAKAQMMARLCPETAKGESRFSVPTWPCWTPRLMATQIGPGFCSGQRGRWEEDHNP